MWVTDLMGMSRERRLARQQQLLTEAEALAVMHQLRDNADMAAAMFRQTLTKATN
jgi:hypothetical protein